MSKHRLIVDDDYNFCSYGLSCHQKDFRVAWYLNSLFKFDFHRFHLDMSDKEGTVHSYSFFRYQDRNNHLNYFLVNNLSDNIPLVKQYKQFNMFMLVEGYIELFDDERFAEKLQNLEAIQFISSLENDPFKKLQYSLFEY